MLPEIFRPRPKPSSSIMAISFHRGILFQVAFLKENVTGQSIQLVMRRVPLGQLNRIQVLILRMRKFHSRNKYHVRSTDIRREFRVRSRESWARFGINRRWSVLIHRSNIVAIRLAANGYGAEYGVSTTKQNIR